jgi:hypothetical protein
METVVSRLQDTRDQVAKQGSAFFTRTLDAGHAFVTETRDAGRELVESFEVEAKRWRRFVTLRASRLETSVRALASLREVERALLVQVDGTLKTIDAGVRTRLAAIDGVKAKAGASRTANGKAPAVARKARVQPQASARPTAQ